MNYLCKCDPCTCGAGTADRFTSARRASRRARACTQATAVHEPPIGAHLITARRGYTHHGIYAGQGTVVHYAGLARDLRPGPIEEVSIERFANGQPVHIECRSSPALSEQDILRRARSRLGERRYRLLTNNCEHFSEWSRFGTSRSHQVERWLGAAPLVMRKIVGQSMQLSFSGASNVKSALAHP